MCDGIDDHEIELYVMGKLEDGPVLAHLDTCPVCKPRVAECRDYVAAMKKALKALEDSRPKQ
jgi:hypothetical protein